MTHSTHLDRVRGCLLGLAIGDALGAPLEGLSAQQVRSHYGTVEDFVDGSRAWKRKPYRWRMPGLYTDDTQQALVLADVLVRRGRIDQDDVAGLYLRLANPKGSFLGAHRAVGRSFRLVVGDLERGASPRETGQDSAGVGASVRIAPVALYFQEDPEGLHEAVLAASLITHRDIRSLAGALLVAHAVRRLLQDEDRSGSLPLRLAADLARAEDRVAVEQADRVTGLPYRRGLSAAVAQVERLLELPREHALQALIEEANRHGAEPSCRRATMGFPPACVPTCLYYLLTTDSFEEALVEVVNLGGDADSAGAIVGALAGAHYGAEAIPERWLAGIRNRDGLERYAAALASHSPGPDGLPDLVATERRLSEEEETSRRGMQAHRSSGGDLGANRRL
jgi:ADP-ribosylglycohydrolase